MSAMSLFILNFIVLHCNTLLQARDKEKKERTTKEKTKEKDKEKEETAPAAAEAAAAPPAENGEDKPSESKRDEPKRKIGNVFALFNQSQIQEFKEVYTDAHTYTCFVINYRNVISRLLNEVHNTQHCAVHRMEQVFKK